MQTPTNALWLTVSPTLKRFDQRLMLQLSRQATLHCWEYQQDVDQPCCMETAITLLHDYLKQQDQPVHLIGHGISGIVGYLYARRFPRRVKSLTLLSVAAPLGHTWHAHYYATRQLLPCSRSMVLAQMARLMFGPQTPAMTKALVRLLAKDLDGGFAPHSLAHRSGFSGGAIQPPLLVGYGGYDILLDPNIQAQWQDWMKAEDCLWTCPQGRHFFHHDYPSATTQKITDFWQGVSLLAPAQTVSSAH